MDDRNHLAAVPGRAKQLDASGGAWKFYGNISDGTGLGWLISSATGLQTQVQPGTEVPQNKKYCWQNSFIKGGKEGISTVSYYT